MRQVELHHGGATHVGLVRETNQDSLLTAPPVFVVADGMGGHDGGEVASRLVVEELARLAAGGFDPAHAIEAVRDAVHRAHALVKSHDAAQRRAGALQFHSATTAVVATLVDDDGSPAWLVANVGDSRVYRVAGGELAQVSVDHSRVQELWEAGEITAEEVATHPERHVVTRAVGGPRPPEPDFFVVPFALAERLLLVSDGVTGMLDDDEIAAVLARLTDPRDAADRLVAEAVRAGGVDNATAVVVDVVGLSPDTAYDSARQRMSLEQKLGALP